MMRGEVETTGTRSSIAVKSYEAGLEEALVAGDDAAAFLCHLRLSGKTNDPSLRVYHLRAAWTLGSRAIKNSASGLNSEELRVVLDTVATELVEALESTTEIEELRASFIEILYRDPIPVTGKPCTTCDDDSCPVEQDVDGMWYCKACIHEFYDYSCQS